MAALHDIIAAYHERLSQVTSPQVANQFLATMSDLAMHHLGFDKQDDPMENAKKLMAMFGMKLTTVTVNDQAEFKIECPFAERVHPLIVSKNPVCPITILVLGAMRVTRRGFVPRKMMLNEKGSNSVFGTNHVH